jgi:type IV fimbrial biogenesis protein FimT
MSKHTGFNGGRRSALGFTLPELAVTLGIAAIMSGLAVPAYNNFVASNRLTTTTNDFVTDVNLARLEAIKRQAGPPGGNGQVALCVTTDGANCAAAPATWANGWMMFWDANGDGAYTAGMLDNPPGAADKLIRTHENVSGALSITTNPASSVFIAFNRVGAMTTALGYLQLTASNSSRINLVCLSGGTGRAMFRPRKPGALDAEACTS